MSAQARFAEVFTNMFSGTQTRLIQRGSLQPEYFSDARNPATTSGHCLSFEGCCFYSFVFLFVSVGQSYRSSSRWWVSTLSDGFFKSTCPFVCLMNQMIWKFGWIDVVSRLSFLVCRLLHHLPLWRTLNRPSEVNWTFVCGDPPPLRQPAGGSDTWWRKAKDNSLWNDSTSCFISIPCLNSCIHTCKHVHTHGVCTHLNVNTCRLTCDQNGRKHITKC